jgi:hypothetical protein
MSRKIGIWGILAIIIFAFLFLVCAPGFAALKPPLNTPEYHLQVSFDIPQKKIRGRATILATSGRKLIIDPGELRILELKNNGKKVTLERRQAGEEIVLVPRGLVEVSYEAALEKTDRNIIDDRDVILLGMWYPQVKGFCRFNLAATLPAGYLAVSEANHITQNDKGGEVEFVFDFPDPREESDGVNFIASKQWIVSKETFRNIDLVTYLFPEEAHLASRYLERTRQTLANYEQLLGPFPYRRLAIVENSHDKTRAMPSAILIDKKVLQQSEVERTPLDHEIVHQWFGCAVTSDYDRGNWCEGMASYFADHLRQEDQDYIQLRQRRILSCFQGIMQWHREFPLRSFQQRFDDASRAVGYCKGAMVIHMLRRQVGDQTFYEAIKRFFQANRFAVASWDDLQKSFEAQSQQDLAWFFRQWVEDIGQPRIRIDKAILQKADQGFKANLALSQEGQVKRLSLPVRFTGPQGSRSFTVDLNRGKANFSFRLDFQPLEMIIDENYDVFRKLAPLENPPTLERLLADRNVWVIPPPGQREPYRQVIDKLHSRGVRIKENLPQTQFKSASLIILGRDNPLLKPLLGETDPQNCPMMLKVRRNPRSSNHLVAVVNAAAEINAAAVDKIFASPFYSTYCIKGENQVSQTLADIEPGIRLQSDQL